MTLTATFTEYDSKRVTGPRGGTKWVTDTIEVSDTLHPVTIKFDVIKTLYIRGKDLHEKYQRLYNLDGSYAKGIWQHGRYGSKMHTECIELFKGSLMTTCSYASGQIKDQHKYLKSINC